MLTLGCERFAQAELAFNSQNAPPSQDKNEINLCSRVFDLHQSLLICVSALCERVQLSKGRFGRCKINTCSLHKGPTVSGRRDEPMLT